MPAGKKLVYIVTQGAPVETMFADVATKYPEFFKRAMGFAEAYLIRGVGVGGGGTVGVPDQYLKQAEELARRLIK